MRVRRFATPSAYAAIGTLIVMSILPRTVRAQENRFELAAQQDAQQNDIAVRLVRASSERGRGRGVAADDVDLSFECVTDKANIEKAVTAAPRRSAVRRVRPLHPHAQQLLTFGQARSPTFAGLVYAIEQSNVIVYVDLDTRTGDDATRSGALFFVAAGDADRWLRIQLHPRTTSWLLTMDRARHLVAILAHELQHALEVASAPWVRDQASFVALFRATGFRNGASNGHEAYDTDAANDVGAHVRDELHGVARLRQHSNVPIDGMSRDCHLEEEQ